MSQAGANNSNSSPIGPDVQSLTGNSGGAVFPDGAGNIDLLGNNTQGINIVGTPASNLLTVSGINATETQIGVVELATDAESIAGASSSNLAIIPSSLAAKLGSQTQYGVALGNTTSGAVNWTAAGTDGQVLIAATGADPAFATITSGDGSITFTPGANSLDMVAGGAVPLQFDTDSGSAVPAANVVNVLGGYNISTSGAGNTITITVDSEVEGTGQTIGAVTADIITFDLGSTAGAYTFEARVAAFTNTGPAGRSDFLVGSARTTGAAGTEIQAEVSNTFSDASISGALAELVISGNDAIIRVTGVAGITINWSAELEFRFVS